ncbi:redoxin domain-containing protein [bacterium]|nr:redoxin domain-containing protein [bacterium]
MNSWCKCFTMAFLLLATLAVSPLPIQAEDDKAIDKVDSSQFKPKTAEAGLAEIETLLRDQANPLPVNERLTKGLEMMDVVWELPSETELKRKMIWMRFSLRSALANMGQEDSIDLLKEDLKTYSQHKDPAVATEATDALLVLEMNMVRSLEPGERMAIIRKKCQEIEQMPADATAGRLAMTLARNLEMLNDPQQAADIADSLSSHFAKSDDGDLKKISDDLKGFSRMINLQGNPMRVVGKKLDGTKLDWQSYRGKVVLVDFWATWCHPCVAEFPQMKKMYKAYHPHGFEIVGISLDRSKEDLDTFIAEREIPWTIVSNVTGDEKSDENALYYGITGIPKMIFVGKDGLVISTDARGEALPKLLAEAFPDVEAPQAEDETEN